MSLLLAFHRGLGLGTLDSVTAGYLETAEWADKPEGSNARFSRAEQATARRVCAAFLQCIGPLADQACELDAYGARQLGADFWLSRCGHGVGFRDRDALDVPAVNAPPMLDRDARPMLPDGPSLRDALQACAYGTRGAISGFAYPCLEAWRGWLSVEGSAEHAMRGHAPTWEFWRAFTLTREV